MASVRSRITVAYGATTFAVLAVFATIVIAQRRAAGLAQLGVEATNTALLAGGIIERQSFRGVAVDTASGPVSPFTPSTTSLLDRLPGYIIIGDSTQVLYWSRDVRRLRQQAEASNLIPEVRERWSQDLETLTRTAYSLSQAGEPRTVSLNFDRVILVASLYDPPLGAGVRRIVAGVSLQRINDTTTEIIETTLLVTPLLLALTIMAAWGLAGRVLEPVGRMVNDVEAITDGRSLHRRVVIPTDARDELGRLAQTVNDMIGRLETSFGALRRFTADASHELRTPLAVIRANIERAMATTRKPHEQAIALEEALQEISRVTHLVESLLTLARADEGRFDVVHDRIDLVPLVHDVAETATILGEDAGVTIRVPLVEPATVLGDRERLRQLLLNLATNAVKYTPRGGAVDISLESRHDEAIVSVRDEGIGIAAADLPFIFDRFWRADRVRSRGSGGGSGLGLAIAQWIAQAHGGRIDVTSRLGRGSLFTVVLPLAPAETPNSTLSDS